jgi:peptidyl-dipeptidase Dcp
MGHVSHNIFSKVRHQSNGGYTGVRDDFSEFPSSFYENFAYEPDFIRSIAKHYVTGEVLNENIIQSLAQSRKFASGFKYLPYLMKTILDIRLHSMTKSEIDSIGSVADLEKEILEKEFGELAKLYSTFLNNFPHMASGYALNYYSYQYGDMAGNDLMKKYIDSDFMNRKSPLKSFQNATSICGGTHESRQFKKLLGRKNPNVQHFIERAGFTARASFNYNASNDNDDVTPPTISTPRVQRQAATARGRAPS